MSPRDPRAPAGQPAGEKRGRERGAQVPDLAPVSRTSSLASPASKGPVARVALGHAETLYENDPATQSGPSSNAGAHSGAHAKSPPRELVAFDGGGNIFEGDEGGDEISLELDMQPTKASMPKLSASLGPSIAAEDPSEVVASMAGAHTLQKGPHAAGANGAADPVEMYEARALAAYGDAPTQWWKAPGYAYRVRTRQKEIERELAARREDQRRAQSQLEDTLVALGQRARPIAEKIPTFKRTIEQIDAAEALLRSRDGQLASDMDAQKAKLASVDQRIGALETTLAAARAEERAAAEELAEIQATIQRAEAKVKRIEIELRTQGSASAPPSSKRGGA